MLLNWQLPSPSITQCSSLSLNRRAVRRASAACRLGPQAPPSRLLGSSGMLCRQADHGGGLHRGRHPAACRSRC
jgi:hypothetical protein